MTEAQRAYEAEIMAKAGARYKSRLMKLRADTGKLMAQIDALLGDTDPDYDLPEYVRTLPKEAVAALTETQMAGLKTQVIEAMQNDIYPYTTCSLLAEKLKWDVAHISAAIKALRIDERVVCAGGRGKGQRYRLLTAPGPEQVNGHSLFENSED